MVYMKAVMKEKISFFLYLCKMMAITYAYCGNNFMIYVSQTSILYFLNVYTAVCLLYLSKMGRRKKEQ